MGKYDLLNRINSPDDLKKISNRDLPQLCAEIRAFLIDSVTETGGHLSSNLGTVELTVALHKIFSVPRDKIVWDVGHQCYTHKLLTGRRNRFSLLRKQGGISGFPRIAESEYDSFGTGHSSTSISAALGLAKSMQLQGNDGYVIAVVGDGAFTGGMIYEALNNAGNEKNKLIIIINDNKESISKSVGMLSNYFTEIRSRPKYFEVKDRTERILKHIPVIGKPLIKILKRIKAVLRHLLVSNTTMFDEMGYVFLGPVDGHNFGELFSVLKRAKYLKRPVIIQTETVKGKGFAPAEKSPCEFHCIAPRASEGSADTFSDEFGRYLSSLADTDEKICAITAAMKSGTGLGRFSLAHSERFFDVGIAEEHAVTFGAALACGGMMPVFCVYSTFLQRSLDQLIHDCAVQNVHFVIGVDRAGIVGDDGETHQGIFDVSYLTLIPGVTVYSPATYNEMRLCLHKALYEDENLVCVRYPKGSENRLAASSGEYDSCDYKLIENGISNSLIIVYGRLFGEALSAMARLKKADVQVSILKLVRLCPLNDKIYSIIKKFSSVFFFEESTENGSVSEKILSELAKRNIQVKITVKDLQGFISHETCSQAFKENELDSDSIYSTVNGENDNG